MTNKSMLGSNLIDNRQGKLVENEKISGVLDFEYSGKGFKEQDIAWALVLRPDQTFMDQYEDLKSFLMVIKVLVVTIHKL